MTSTSDSIRAGFAERLRQPGIIVAPGVYDALSALLAEQAGFEAVFFSGAAMATAHLGMTDVGLLSMTEIATIVQRAADRVSIPIVVDIDQGYGGAPHAARAMRSFDCAGAAAVQVEDQQVVKPQRDLTSRPLVPVSEMQDKIKAMLDARESVDMLLSARTDATDAQEAIDRCCAYREAGADLVFPERITDTVAIRSLRERMGSDVPLLYNNSYPQAEAKRAAQLEALGVTIVLFPALGVRSAVDAISRAFAGLAADPDLDGGGRSPISAAEVEAVLGTQDYLGKFQ